MGAQMMTDKDLTEFADFLVAWLERDLKAGRVKEKPQADMPEALPQSGNSITHAADGPRLRRPAR
jgi:hypothetical protein